MPTSRILVVEDELIIAEAMKDGLAEIGLSNCLHASSLEDAMTAVRGGDVAGALLDIRLNGDLVFPVAELLRAKGVPFAFCSGNGDASVIPETLEGAPILSKPWPPGELERLAERLFKASA